MEEINFIKSQLLQLEYLLSLCEGHPLMSVNLKSRIEDFKERLTYIESQRCIKAPENQDSKDLIL